MRKYRERKKEANKSQNQKHTRAKEQELEKKLQKWRELKAAERAGWTVQKKRRVNEKRMARYYENKQKQAQIKKGKTVGKF